MRSVRVILGLEDLILEDIVATDGEDSNMRFFFAFSRLWYLRDSSRMRVSTSALNRLL